MASKSGKYQPKPKDMARQWRRIDLHLHTPGSEDYQEPQVTYLDILRQAEIRGLDIIAFTDHNSVAGFTAMKKEIEKLLWLEELGRIEPDEKRRLEEYRRLLNKILVLPGFEFTAMFGFHILGIFPQDTPMSYLEHLLLTLNVPPDIMSKGKTTAGATSDVLTAYRVIDQAGGIVIAAHANSGNGVAMRGLDFGGQTRIAYTQDVHLHALEVTDLEKRGHYTTRRFFDGSKPEYPRPMRCIQGSDAHRLVRDPKSPKSLGVGERVTEIFLEAVTFAALADVLKGNDLSLTRPFRGRAEPLDFVQLAREEGPSIVQAFHESLLQRGGYQDRILQDICAMANTNGGTIYVGVTDNPKDPPVGVNDVQRAIERLQAKIAERFSPEPELTMDELLSKGRHVVRIVVHPGTDIPYALDENKFFVRDEAETTLAVRDEIVRLVERNLSRRQAGGEHIETQLAPAAPAVVPPTVPVNPRSEPQSESALPRTGVEIVESQQRKNGIYHSVRDLRNGNLIKNVTKSSARKLWHYAITQAESHKPDAARIQWINDKAVLNMRRKDDYVWYDLALKEENEVRVFYGVTDSGLNDEWLAVIEQSGMTPK
ncbi:MAG: hypothetical protein Fur0021_32130 [Candidatus Promineifilaceae bacterium]